MTHVESDRNLSLATALHAEATEDRAQADALRLAGDLVGAERRLIDAALHDLRADAFEAAARAAHPPSPPCPARPRAVAGRVERAGRKALALVAG